jgi:uncharacterized protein YbjQ (UPF0145 family)
MIITTTPNIEGNRITEYLGLVNGETIMGANIFADIFASIRNVIGGRSGAYEKELRKAKEIAIKEMEQEAVELGADAIVGVDLDYETITSDQGSMLMVIASGTAIKLESTDRISTSRGTRVPLE